MELFNKDDQLIISEQIRNKISGTRASVTEKD